MFVFSTVIIFLLYFYCCWPTFASAQSHTNFEVRRAEVCPPNKPPLVQYWNITKETGKHYENYEVWSHIPIDDNVGVEVVIEYAIDGKTFLHLFTIKEKNLCKAANMYLREYWYEFQRAAGLSPGVCPMRAGHHATHHRFIDYKKIGLQTFPFGRLRFTIHVLENSNRRVIGCLLLEVDNVEN